MPSQSQCQASLLILFLCAVFINQVRRVAPTFHEPTPSPSEEGCFVVRAGCRFPSWEGGRGGFMEPIRVRFLEVFPTHAQPLRDPRQRHLPAGRQVVVCARSRRASFTFS